MQNKGDIMRKSAEATAAETGKPSLAQVGTQLNEAQVNLSQRLYEATVEGYKRLAAVADGFATAKQELDLETVKRAVEAATEYNKSAEQAVDKETGQQILAEAYQNYIKTLEGLHTESCRRLQDLHTQHTAKWVEARESSMKDARSHYVDHLRKVQQIWASLDVESLVA
jgi:hypothetical protein